MFDLIIGIKHFFLTIVKHGVLHDCTKAWTMTTKVENLKSLKYQRFSWKFQHQRGISAFYLKRIYFDIEVCNMNVWSQRVLTYVN